MNELTQMAIDRLARDVKLFQRDLTDVARMFLDVLKDEVSDSFASGSDTGHWKPQ
jgi:hypothetical protein